jgi:putative ABC transport system substrate-binding protein
VNRTYDSPKAFILSATETAMKKVNPRVILFVLMLFVSGGLAEAQQSTKVPLIGVLITSSASAAASRIKILVQGLRELGYVEGKNILFEYRYAQGTPETLAARVDELIRLKVDILVVDTSNAINAAKNATKTIPIIFTNANDPIGDGQVASLAKPGGNLTGFSNLANELNGKRLELLKEAFPKITRVGFLIRIDSTVGEKRFQEAAIVAKELKLRLQPISANSAGDLESVFAVAKRAGIQGVIGSPSTFLNINRAQIFDLAAKHRFPAIYPSAPFSEAGGLMSYGPDGLDNWRRAATYVDKILKGDKPGELPVQQPMKFEFVVNLKAAKQIGVTIPPNVLVRANRVIK